MPICVNASDWDAKLEEIDVVVKARRCGRDVVDQVVNEENPRGVAPYASKKTVHAIRLGLRLVVGLCAQNAKNLVALRQKTGPWDDIETFLKDTSLSRVDLTCLAAANALKVFGADRRAAIWLAEAAPYSRYLKESETSAVFPKETEMELVQADYAATSTSLGRHPTTILKEQAWVYQIPLSRIVTTTQLSSVQDHEWMTTFGMIVVRQAPPTAGGMLFMTLEDETGLMNLVIRPKIYEKYAALIENQAFLCILGKLERKGEASNIVVSQIFSPTIKQVEVIPLHQSIQSSAQSSAQDSANMRDSVFDKSRNYM